MVVDGQVEGASEEGERMQEHGDEDERRRPHLRRNGQDIQALTNAATERTLNRRGGMIGDLFV